MTSEGQARLLVVDDNGAQRMALLAALADLNISIVEAASGREALRHLLHDEFAAILLDVNMPGLDGFETAELIRSRPNSEHTPIIFITAYSDDAHAARGYSLGAVDYILAPVQPNVLRAKVSVFIDVFEKSRELIRQREELRRYADQLQQLTQASVEINAAQSVEDVLREVTSHAARIIGAHQAGTSVVLHDSVTVSTATVASEKHGGLSSVRSGGSVHPLLTSLRQPRRVTELELSRPEAPLSPPEILAGVPLRGWLAAPLMSRDGRPVGLVELSDKLEGEFSAEDETILVYLAQMASIAIESTLTSEAREANRLKDEFLGVLSHELRTPLQAMLTWISILRTGAVDPGTTARGLEVIERSAKTQTQLIEDLLDVSRIIRGQMRLEVGPMELVKVIGLAIETLKPSAAAKNLHLVWQPPVVSYRIVGDASRLQQIVWNLVANAVKFTPRDGRIEVRLLPETGQVVIEVRDTGPGIPAQFLPHVFERFRQADSTAGRQHGGLGLGLAIVHHLVELHGGTVSASNDEAGGGAVFAVRLPAESADRTLVKLLPAPAGWVQSSPSKDLRLDGIRVMVVEDGTEARECLAAALQLYGAEVMAVGSAADALAALDERPPDVLLSDLAMPGEDGHGLIQRIREREFEHGGRLPAAALTACVRAEDRAGALRAGFDVHVNKPILPIELARLVGYLAGRTSEL